MGGGGQAPLKIPSPNVSETKINARSFKDGSSLPELCHPSLVSIQDVAKGELRAEAEASGTRSPLLQHQGQVPGCSANPSPTGSPQGCVWGEDCLSAPPPCPRRPGSHLSAVSRRG